MDTEEKIRFALSTIKPMAEMTLPYLSSVIGILDDGKKGKHLGSAIKCQLQGRKALVTAFHVIDQAMSYYRGLAVTAGFGSPPYVIHGEIQFEEWSDVLVYFLPPDFPEVPTLSFWPEERIDRAGDRLGTDVLFLHGFPENQSEFSTTSNGIQSRSLPYGCMQRLDDLPNDLKPFEFALEFDPSGMTANALPMGVSSPYGLSGSPVWRIGASGLRAKDWRPDWSLLVGVVTQWRQPERILVATKASEIFNLLQKTGALH